MNIFSGGQAHIFIITSQNIPHRQSQLQFHPRFDVRSSIAQNRQWEKPLSLSRADNPTWGFKFSTVAKKRAALR
jgi:hypothetical protein